MCWSMYDRRHHVVIVSTEGRSRLDGVQVINVPVLHTYILCTETSLWQFSFHFMHIIWSIIPTKWERSVSMNWGSSHKHAIMRRQSGTKQSFTRSWRQLTDEKRSPCTETKFLYGPGHYSEPFICSLAFPYPEFLHRAGDKQPSPVEAPAWSAAAAGSAGCVPRPPGDLLRQWQDCFVHRFLRRCVEADAMFVVCPDRLVASGVPVFWTSILGSIETVSQSVKHFLMKTQISDFFCFLICPTAPCSLEELGIHLHWVSVVQLSCWHLLFSPCAHSGAQWSTRLAELHQPAPHLLRNGHKYSQSIGPTPLVNPPLPRCSPVKGSRPTPTVSTSLPVLESSMGRPIWIGCGKQVMGQTCMPPSGYTWPVCGWMVTARIGTGTPVSTSAMGTPSCSLWPGRRPLSRVSGSGWSEHWEVG